MEEYEPRGGGRGEAARRVDYETEVGGRSDSR